MITAFILFLIVVVIVLAIAGVFTYFINRIPNMDGTLKQFVVLAVWVVAVLIILLRALAVFGGEAILN